MQLQALCLSPGLHLCWDKEDPLGVTWHHMWRKTNIYWELTLWDHITSQACVNVTLQVPLFEVGTIITLGLQLGKLRNREPWILASSRDSVNLGSPAPKASITYRLHPGAKLNICRINKCLSFPRSSVVSFIKSDSTVFFLIESWPRHHAEMIEIPKQINSSGCFNFQVSKT